MKTKFNFKMLGALAMLGFSSLSLQAQNTFPASGNVGLGTLSPTYPLEVVSHTNYNVARFLRGTGGTADQSAIIDIQNGGGTLWRTGVGGTGNGIGLNAGQFYIERSGAGALFTMNQNGYTGIGTSSPSYRLHVASSDVRAFQIDGSYAGYSGMYINATDANGMPFYGYIANGKYAWTYLDPSGSYKIYNGGDRLTVLNNGNVLINKTSQVNSAYKLDVNGSVRANEVVVNTTGADFVFEDKYKLRDLSEVESFIKTNKHLPEIPSAAVMTEEGMNVGDLSKTLLQKVEELTLYMIEMKKENEALKARVAVMESTK